MKTELNTVREAESQEASFQKKSFRVTADLKGYRIKQLNDIGKTNSDLVTEPEFKDERR